MDKGILRNWTPKGQPGKFSINVIEKAGHLDMVASDETVKETEERVSAIFKKYGQGEVSKSISSQGVIFVNNAPDNAIQEIEGLPTVSCVHPVSTL